MAACHKKDEKTDLISNLPAVSVAPALPAPEKKVEQPKYFYPYSDYRDPFTPLLGGQGYGRGSGQLMAQNLGNLELKGILKDRRGKVAIITSGDGESYVLKSGRIYDQRNHLINGVTGIIKETSVVLIAANNTVKELPLKRTGAYKY